MGMESRHCDGCCNCNCEVAKSEFLANYNGSLSPEAAWQRHKLAEESKRFDDATYSESLNRELARNHRKGGRT